ncbi:MAG TPA: alpha/beta fold hydrolase [Gammaproteobacteria bacterium]
MVPTLVASDSGPANAPAVVLLHSLATSSAMWAPQLPIWSEHFRIVNVDLPGHGACPPPDGALTFSGLGAAVCALLDARSIPAAAVVGLSLGGMTAQAFAIEHPERVRALVLAHTLAFATDAMRRTWDERIASVEALGMDGQVESTIERWFTPEFRTAAPLTTAWIARMIRATDPRGFAAAGRAIQSLDHLERLAAVTAPALVVAGKHDPGAPPAAAEAMAAKLRRSELTLLESSHLGNVEQATAFTETVGAFLERTA